MSVLGSAGVVARRFVVERALAASVEITGELRAGAAAWDITPALGEPLSGYGSFRSEAAQRMCGRLFATTLVLDDGRGERVALVAIDLHAGTRYLAELAAARLAASCGVGIDRLFLAGTHTHSGPGHIYGNTLFDGMTAAGRGLDERGAARIADGIASAVELAVSRLAPARLGAGSAVRWGFSMNRSVDAFRHDGAAPARFAERFGPPPRGLTDENLAVDPRVTVLWAESTDGAPIGVFGSFSVHATAIAARHATLSADVFGRAVHAAQDRLFRAGLTASRVPIALAAGAVGDVDLDLQGIGATAMVERQGVETAGRIGEAIGESIDAACREARGALTREVSLRSLFTEPEPAGARLSDGRVLGAEAVYGVPALAGSELGRNFMLDPAKLSTALSLEGSRSSYDPEDPHAPKLTAMRGLVAKITGQAAPVLPLRLVEIKLGERRVAIAGLPGEPTTRFAAGVERMLRDRGAAVTLVTGLTGDYAGYFAAEKEYEKQHYEGACTIWGRATQSYVLETLRNLSEQGTPPLEPSARFESDASYSPEAAPFDEPREAWPAAPTLELNGANLLGRWTAHRADVPPFGPDPWILIEQRHQGAWRPLTWLGAPVTDQSRELLVERVARGALASWHFRWLVPAELRSASLRFVLLPAAFGGSVASNPVAIVDGEDGDQAPDTHGRSRAAAALDFTDDFHHPSTEEELVALVDLARERRCALRVRGSGHSIAQAIYSDALLDGRAGSIDVMLDRYTKIAFDPQRRRVTVEAGCHLGLDPRDPTGTSTWEKSLLAALDGRGWALPDLGGVTHQTVSGFLMTGSSGGTVQHAIEDAVVAIRFIDGLGEVREVERGKHDLFDAVVCSMGLLGVVSTITFQCVPRFDIVGREDITTQDGASYALFDGGPRGLASFLRKTEYARLMWWPQQGVERVVTWQARRMTDADYDDETGARGALVPKRYQALGDDLPRGRLSRPVSDAVQWAGGKFYDAIATAGDARAALEKRLPAAAPLTRAASSLFATRLLPAVLGQFVPLDAKGPQRFWDSWFGGLPMDNQMSDASLPTTFTEIFVPLDEAPRAMKLLREHFRAGGIDATGTFIFEIYASRATRGWLHPSYGRDSLRIDVFWFERSREDPTKFFEQFWDLFAPLGYRLHWGKHLPADKARGARYLRRQYPRWDDFLRLRQKLDPLGIFLNDHFRAALGVEVAAQDPRLMSVMPQIPGAPSEDSPIAIAVRDLPRLEPRALGLPRPPAKSIEGAALPARVLAFYEDLVVARRAALDRVADLFAADVEHKGPLREALRPRRVQGRARAHPDRARPHARRLPGHRRRRELHPHLRGPRRRKGHAALYRLRRRGRQGRARGRLRGPRVPGSAAGPARAPDRRRIRGAREAPLADAVHARAQRRLARRELHARAQSRLGLRGAARGRPQDVPRLHGRRALVTGLRPARLAHPGGRARRRGDGRVLLVHGDARPDHRPHPGTAFGAARRALVVAARDPNGPGARDEAGRERRHPFDDARRLRRAACIPPDAPPGRRRLPELVHGLAPRSRQDAAEDRPRPDRLPRLAHPTAPRTRSRCSGRSSLRASSRPQGRARIEVMKGHRAIERGDRPSRKLRVLGTAVVPERPAIRDFGEAEHLLHAAVAVGRDDQERAREAEIGRHAQHDVVVEFTLLPVIDEVVAARVREA